MRKFTVLLFTFLLIKNMYAQDVLPKPDKYYSVVDKVSLLQTHELSALTTKLDAFKQKTGNELVVVIIGSCDSLTIEEYANKLFNNWGIGQKEQNNGILLLIAINDRNMRIHTGYGIETIITDAEAASIIDNILIRYFKNGKYYEGLEISTNFMINEMRTGFDYRQYALKGYENINKYNFNISPAANRKDSLNPKIVSTILFLGQLLFLIGLVRHSKRNAMIKRYEFLFTLGVVLNFFLFLLILYIVLNYKLDAGTEFYSRINMYSLNGFLITCSCYLLVLLPVTYGKVLAKVIKELVRLFSFLIIAFFVSLPVLYVTVEVFDLNSNIPLLISIIIVLVILYYFDRHGALSTGWGRGGSSGGGGGGSSYSGSSGGGYGGGSSGGGGASGSW